MKIDRKAVTKRLALYAALVLLAAPFIIDYGVRAYSTTYILTNNGVEGLKADCILVLGAGVRDDDRPSVILSDRLRTGISLYNMGVSSRLLMSGDHGQRDYDEVNVMKAYALEHGVPSAHVFMDHAGFSTYESMVRAKEVFKAQNIIIVTQRFHLPRAIYIARRIGLNASGVPADINIYSGRRYNEARKFLARIKDYFYVLVRPAPKYLGEVIPVSGDGDITNDKT